jgi:hypothetical protein
MTKNLHLQHPEDEVLTGNLNCLDWMCDPKSHISIKMDGSPALVFGTNPANGEFCVGTKSIFNKVKIKINHSHEEIDANHDGKVADILHLAFDCLPRCDSIIQCDYIGSSGYDTYKPNTISYKFPKVITQDIIVCPHTIYGGGDDLRNVSAAPLMKKLKSTDRCLFVQPDVEICPYREDIEDFCKFARQMSTLCTFVSDKQAKELKKVINSYIREGKEVDEHEIAENYDVDINLMRLWKLIESIKMDLFCYIESDTDITCQIDGRLSDHEGYVMTNKYGTYKIVNRDEFSRLNFVLPKNWI